MLSAGVCDSGKGRAERRLPDQRTDSGDPEYAIEAEGLSMSFGDVKAVDGIDLKVARGELFGLLGPNGAGKTTTIRMLTTLLHPDSGRIKVEGMDASSQVYGIRGRIGVVQQHISLDKDISVRENLMHHAKLHKVPRPERGPRMDGIISLLGLEPYLGKLVSDLSGGWKKRTAIACSLIHAPSVLFLDEPTTGLDTQSRHLLWNIIQDLNREGTTIILTTHYMEEAEALCDRVALISRGRIVADDTPRNLCAGLGNIAVVHASAAGRDYRFFDTRTEAKAFADTLGAEEDSVSIRKTRLEDVFLEMTGRMAGTGPGGPAE